MLLAGCRLLWLSLGWSLCTCNLERHTNPHATFPRFEQVGSVGLLSMLTSLGILIDSYTFPWFSFLRPTRAELFGWVTFQHWSPLMCTAAVRSPALSSRPITSSSAREEQECCSLCTPATEGNCPATGGEGVFLGLLAPLSLSVTDKSHKVQPRSILLVFRTGD